MGRVGRRYRTRQRQRPLRRVRPRLSSGTNPQSVLSELYRDLTGRKTISRSYIGQFIGRAEELTGRRFTQASLDRRAESAIDTVIRRAALTSPEIVSIGDESKRLKEALRYLALKELDTGDFDSFISSVETVYGSEIAGHKIDDLKACGFGNGESDLSEFASTIGLEHPGLFKLFRRRIRRPRLETDTRGKNRLELWHEIERGMSSQFVPLKRAQALLRQRIHDTFKENLNPNDFKTYRDIGRMLGIGQGSPDSDLNQSWKELRFWTAEFRINASNCVELLDPGFAEKHTVGESIYSRLGELSDIFDIRFRDYQVDKFEAITDSIARGDDRGLDQSPWQVGKTVLIGPLAYESYRGLFPGKKTLVVVPFKIIKEEILSDLLLYPDRKKNVGVIDANRKDFDGDHEVVVASAFTLGTERNLKRLNPNDYGLVVVDEATFSDAPMWRGILTKLGFLEKDGTIRYNRGKYLLGLTADPFSLAEIFGEGAKFDSPSLIHYIRNEHLHDVEGIRVPYEPTVEMMKIADESGVIVTPRHPDVLAKAVLETYKNECNGKQTLVYVATIDQAKAVEEEFDRNYGSGFAKAVHSEMNDTRVGDIVWWYSDKKSSLKVLISISKLAYGYRAKGTEVVIHSYESGSIRRYGQRLGRALGIIDNEPQRKILNIDMSGKAYSHTTPVSLPRLFGFYGYQSESVPFRPLKVSAKRVSEPPKQKRLKPVKGGKGGLFAFQVADRTSTPEMPDRFPRLINDALGRRFENDLNLMSTVLKIDVDELHSYLSGEFPRDIRRVYLIEEGLGLNPDSLVQVWIEDTLDIIETIHPTPENYGPKVSEFIKLIRFAVLERGKGSVRSSIPADLFTGSFYHLLLRTFGGKYPIKAEPLKDLDRFVAYLEIVSDAERRRIFSVAFEEYIEGAKSSGKRVPKYDPEGLDYDPLYIDAMDKYLVYVERPEDIDSYISGGNDSDIGHLMERSAYYALAAEAEGQKDMERRRHLYRAFMLLKPAEEDVIRKYYGIGEAREYTQTEIAELLKVSRGRVWQRLQDAMRKLRAPRRLNKQLFELYLNDFPEPVTPETLDGYVTDGS